MHICDSPVTMGSGTGDAVRAEPPRSPAQGSGLKRCQRYQKLANSPSVGPRTEGLPKSMLGVSRSTFKASSPSGDGEFGEERGGIGCSPQPHPALLSMAVETYPV